LIITKSKRFLVFNPWDLLRGTEDKLVIETDQELDKCHHIYGKAYLCEKETVNLNLYDSVRKANIDDLLAKVVFYE